jgi:hypothetical protein
MMECGHLEQKKRNVPIVCLVAILVAVLALSCQPGIKGCRSMLRRGEVSKIINKYWKRTGGNFRVRGPLSIAQVQEELFGRPLNSSDIHGAQGSTDLAKAWDSVKAKYREGDELYFFTADERSWAELNGRRGYALIRKDQVVDILVTFLN